MGDKVSPEYMQCQIEVGTGVCADIGVARKDLQNLRRCVAREAAKLNLAPISASCHPFGDWKQQGHRDRARYNQLKTDLGGVARRMLIWGCMCMWGSARTRHGPICWASLVTSCRIYWLCLRRRLIGKAKTPVSPRTGSAYSTTCPVPGCPLIWTVGTVFSGRLRLW